MQGRLCTETQRERHMNIRDMLPQANQRLGQPQRKGQGKTRPLQGAEYGSVDTFPSDFWLPGL